MTICERHREHTDTPHCIGCERDEMRAEIERLRNMASGQERKFEMSQTLCRAALAAGDVFAQQIEYWRPVYEAAKEWHVARCTRMPSCDPYVGTHDAECLLAIAECHLTNALDVAIAAESAE